MNKELFFYIYRNVPITDLTEVYEEICRYQKALRWINNSKLHNKIRNQIYYEQRYETKKVSR